MWLWMMLCISHDQCRFHRMYESDSWEYYTMYIWTKREKNMVEMHNIFHSFWNQRNSKHISHMAIDCSVTHSAIQMLHILYRKFTSTQDEIWECVRFRRNYTSWYIYMNAFRAIKRIAPNKIKFYMRTK